MRENHWKAYLTHRIARVRARIQETERLMRPPTQQELISLSKELELLKAQEKRLTQMLTAAQPDG
jgi:uncharacterized protein involved in exopolysaccharide biosynthesis